MTGEDIIGARLLASAAITDLVPAAQIKAGRLPENAAMPSLLVRTISTIERQSLKRGARVFVVERVSVTVRAAKHSERKAIMKLLPGACVGFEAESGDATNISALTAGAGPDVDGPGNTFERGQDFRVSFETPA
jgi:hypothetical protein